MTERITERIISERRSLIIRAVLLVLGLTLIALGIWRGELAEILRRATTVCLECIGIG